MNLHLPLLADINLHIGVAEEAVASGSWSTARLNLDKAEESFAELRTHWPEQSENEKGLLAAMVQPLKGRYKQLLQQLPGFAVITEGAVEHDPDEETAPVESI